MNKSNTGWREIRQEILKDINKRIKKVEKLQQENPELDPQTLQELLTLPSDAEYTKRFNTSVSPIMRALKSLDGMYISRQRGRKSKIIMDIPAISNDSHLEHTTGLIKDRYQQSTKLIGVEERLKAQGVTHRAQVLNFNKVKELPELELCDDLPLSIEQTDNLYTVTRVIMIEEKPQILHKCLINDFAEVFGDNFLFRQDFSKQTPLDLYHESDYSVTFREALIEAINPNEEESLLLNIEKQQPVLKVNQVTYATHTQKNDIQILEILTALYKDWKYHVYR